jgi:hypothetical protein
MTIIKKIFNDWKDVKNVSRTTVNKVHTEKEATTEFKKKILISEHSPIREISVRWRWEEVKSWVCTHFSRHKWEVYIATQRSDRINENRDERPQGQLIDMDCSANAQHLIDTARKRLCFGSSPETRSRFENLKVEIHKEGETELSDALVPNCVYRCGCPEFVACPFWSKFKEDNPAIFGTIQQRYDSYNKYFHNKRES